MKINLPFNFTLTKRLIFIPARKYIKWKKKLNILLNMLLYLVVFRALGCSLLAVGVLQVPRNTKGIPLAPDLGLKFS